MKLLIVGAGGHAKVVLDAAKACGFEIAGILGIPGGCTELLGHPVTWDATDVEADGFIAAIGDSATRAAEFQQLKAAGLSAVSVVHPTAIIAEDVEIGEGTFVAAGVIVNTGARIGLNVILNTGCTIDHDCIIATHAHVGPGANLCGAARVGTGTLIGVGSCMVPGVSVGDWSVVGAGAAVTRDLPSHSTCAGVPARPLPPQEAHQ